MIDETPLQGLLRTLTYKPDWSFYIKDNFLVIEAKVINANNHKQIIPLSHYSVIPATLADSDFNWTSWLFNEIMRVEHHEVAEFFHINGVKVFDPHG